MEEDPSRIKACTLEVDLDIPETKEFHDYTKDYPLAPESKVINGVSKLVPNLLHKRNYVVHHKALQCYLRLGAKLEKIHKGVSYEEKEFLREYIETNQKKRETARNKFEKDFYKLLNNAVFGKTMENVRYRCGIKLVNGANEKGEKKLLKFYASSTFKGSKVFEGSALVSVNMAKKEVILNKPIAVGQAILDLSTVVMFNFDYDDVLKRWPGKTKLLATDADSLMYEIGTSDIFQDINPDVKTHFDTSDYPKDHPSGILTGQNKKVLGLFKDEMQGKIVKEFVGPRAKCYALSVLDDVDFKKAKGVPKKVVKKSIHFDHYKKCLFEGKIYMTEFMTLRAREHVITNDKVTKIALSRDDDKRYLLENETHETLPHCHYAIPKEHKLL